MPPRVLLPHHRTESLPSTTRRYLARVGAAIFATGALVLAAGPAHATPPPPDAPPDVSAMPAVGFSNLVLRIEGDDGIGMARDDFRIFILEALRHDRLNA